MNDNYMQVGTMTQGCMQGPRYSIITVTKNNINELKKTCRSVMCQTFCDYEHIIIDGGEMKHGLLGHRHMRQIGTGLSEAFNQGRRAANGRYLLFLNAGDELLDASTLSKVDACIRIKGDSDETVYFGNWYIDCDGYRKCQIASDQNLLRSNTLCHQAVLFGARAHAQADYDGRLKTGMDYDLYLRLKKLVNFKKIDVCVALFYYGGISSHSGPSIRRVVNRTAIRLMNRGDSDVGMIVLWKQFVSDLIKEIVQPFKELLYKSQWVRQKCGWQ